MSDQATTVGTDGGTPVEDLEFTLDGREVDGAARASCSSPPPSGPGPSSPASATTRG